MKLHQICIYCKHAIYTTLPRGHATFSHTLIWCFQPVKMPLLFLSQRCERAPTCLAKRRGGPTAGWCWSWDHRLGLLLPCREVVFPPIHLPSVVTPNLSLGELAPPSPKWHILPKQANLPPPQAPRAPSLSLARHCCPIYSNHISNVEGCFHYCFRLHWAPWMEIFICRWQLSATKGSYCSSTQLMQCCGASFIQ